VSDTKPIKRNLNSRARAAAAAIVKLCADHGLVLSHEDHHGAFEFTDKQTDLDTSEGSEIIWSAFRRRHEEHNE
jgi:hypothetical protein